MLVSKYRREPASEMPSISVGSSILMRYQAKVKPFERLLRMFVHTSQLESSYSAKRAGLLAIWAARPSLGWPGTSPCATRHCPLTCLRSSGLFRSRAILGIFCLLSGSLVVIVTRVRVRSVFDHHGSSLNAPGFPPAVSSIERLK